MPGGHQATHELHGATAGDELRLRQRSLPARHPISAEKSLSGIM
jgi:hypothetical protein